jgi:hypothetical protein
MTRYPFQPKPLLRIIRIGMQVTANSGFGNANQNFAARLLDQHSDGLKQKPTIRRSLRL